MGKSRFAEVGKHLLKVFLRERQQLPTGYEVQSYSVLIVCQEKDFLESYIQTASSVIGGTNVFAVRSVEELEEWQPERLRSIRTVILDCKTLTKNQRLDELPNVQKVITSSPALVVLNANLRSSFSHEIERLCPGAELKDSYVPERYLRRILQTIALPVILPRNIERDPPVAGSISVEADPNVDMDEFVQEILRRIMGPIHLDPGRLREEFIDVTSEDVLPEPISRRLPDMMNIGNAVKVLTTFMKASTSGNIGKIIVGEKGVGKTTLAHYSAAQYFMTDPSLLFVAIDYQWIPIYELESDIDDLIETLRATTVGRKLEDSMDFPRLLRSWIEQDSWEHMDMPSVRVRNQMTSLIKDDGFVVGMYCHFTGKPELLRLMVDKYGKERDELVENAREWLTRIEHDYRKLLVYTLVFELEREKKGFEDFSWCRFFASLILASRRNEDVSQIMLKRLPRELRKRLQDGSLSGEDILSGVREMGTSLEAFGVGLLRDLDKYFKVVFLLDNIDARFNVPLEARLIRFSMSFIQSLLRSVQCGVIVCVRTATYVSKHFQELELENLTRWTSIQVRPPDLNSILKRRVERMRNSGMYIGTSGWWFMNFLYDLVNGISKGDWLRDIPEIIKERYPDDVRGQLDLFCIAASSTIIHHYRTRALRTSQRTPWAEVSYEFCLRSLVWGKQSFYTESRQRFVPNVYNNGFSHSPFNALIRPLILGWAYVYPKGSFALDELIRKFFTAGVPESEIVTAVDNAIVYDLIERDYGNGGKWHVTRWGKYLYDHVIFDLPYIQTVWWDVPMLKLFSIGAPRLLDWNELNQPTQIFERWLYAEEEMVRRGLNVELKDIIQKESIWQTVSVSLGFALNSIERSVYRRVAPDRIG